MKKMYCPKCGKELINLSLEKNISEFWCDDCNISITVEEDSKPIEEKNLFSY